MLRVACFQKLLFPEAAAKFNFFGTTGMACHLVKKSLGRVSLGWATQGAFTPQNTTTFPHVVNPSHVLVCILNVMHCCSQPVLLKLALLAAPLGKQRCREAKSQNFPMQKDAL